MHETDDGDDHRDERNHARCEPVDGAELWLRERRSWTSTIEPSLHGLCQLLTTAKIRQQERYEERPHAVFVEQCVHSQVGTARSLR